MLPYQVSERNIFRDKQNIYFVVSLIGIVSNLQALDSRILDNIPVAPQLVRQPGRVSGFDQRAWTGASLLSPRDQMDVSVNLLPAGQLRHDACTTLFCCHETSHDLECRLRTENSFTFWFLLWK